MSLLMETHTQWSIPKQTNKETTITRGYECTGMLVRSIKILER